MKTELDSLATALYVKTDDLLKDSPQLAPWRPAAGTALQLSDAELATLAMMQAILVLYLRGPLAAVRPRSPTAPVSLPAAAARL